MVHFFLPERIGDAQRKVRRNEAGDPGGVLFMKRLSCIFQRRYKEMSTVFEIHRKSYPTLGHPVLFSPLILVPDLQAGSYLSDVYSQRRGHGLSAGLDPRARHPSRQHDRLIVPSFLPLTHHSPLTTRPLSLPPSDYKRTKADGIFALARKSVPSSSDACA